MVPQETQVIFPKGHRQLCYVDGWDPELNEIRQFRVLEDAEDAWSGEEYFRHTDNGGLARYVRPDRRRRYNVRELNALEAYQFMDDDDDEEEVGEEENNVRDAPMEVDQSPQDTIVPREQVELPGEHSEPDPEDHEVPSSTTSTASRSCEGGEKFQ